MNGQIGDNGVVERPSPPAGMPQWLEVNASGVRVRFKPNILSPSLTRDLTLHTIVTGDVLPSVSSRDPRRSLATVWTSGNRVFRIDNALLLRSSLKASLNGADPEEYGLYRAVRGLASHERLQLNEALRHLIQVVRTEQEEYLIGASP